MWPYPWTHVGTPYHLGHMDRVAATMPSQAHAGAAQEAPDIGQWEGQDVPLVRPSSCNVKGGIPSSRRYLPTSLSPPSASSAAVTTYSCSAVRGAVGVCVAAGWRGRVSRQGTWGSSCAGHATTGPMVTAATVDASAVRSVGLYCLSPVVSRASRLRAAV